MQPPDEKKGAPASGPDHLPAPETAGHPGPESPASPADQYEHYEDPYGYHPGDNQAGSGVRLDQMHTIEQPPSSAVVATSNGGHSAPPPPTPEPESDDDDDGMLRMSFMEHLEELRSRIIKALIGIGVAFGLSLFFANELWKVVSAPATDALKAIGAKPELVFLSPTEAFSTIWFKMPLLVSLFLASPWVLYQVWAFIAPGLYSRERRFAVPFVVSTAGLFISGGCFAYFVAFRFGLTFLLGIGHDIGVTPAVTVTEYFDLFVDVMLGIGLVFELPIIIFFLCLLRIATPAFLMKNSRYAILLITIVAAVVTPTPDIFNLMLFAVPMWMLFFIGVFAGYLLVLRREKRSFPWGVFFMILGAIIVIALGAAFVAVSRYHYHVLTHWPYLSK